MLGSARLEPRDLLLHLIDQALERPQGQLLDVGIVSRILANRLISRLERAQFFSRDFDFAFVFQFHDTASIMS